MNKENRKKKGRAYFELPQEELAYAAEAYPTTFNKEIAARLGICEESVCHLAKRFGWKKNLSAVYSKLHCGKLLSDEEKEWLKEAYTGMTETSEILGRLGISLTQLRSLVVRLGLKRPKERIRENGRKGKGKKKDKTGIIARWNKIRETLPREEWPGYKLGKKPWEQAGMSKEKYDAGLLKKSITLKRLYKMEHFRVSSGKPQQTRLRLKQLSKRQRLMKYRMARRCDYFYAKGEPLVICYDEQTKRLGELEQEAAAMGLQVLPADED